MASLNQATIGRLPIALPAIGEQKRIADVLEAFDDRITLLRETNATLTGLHRDLFCEANPIPVKWAVARMGLVGDGLRLPLTPLSAAHHERVRAAMRKAGIQA